MDIPISEKTNMLAPAVQILPPLIIQMAITKFFQFTLLKSVPNLHNFNLIAIFYAHCYEMNYSCLIITDLHQFKKMLD